MLLDSDIKIARAVARVRISTPSSRALINSGLLGEIAAENTTMSAPSTLLAMCVVVTVAPSALSALRTEESFESEPLTCIECESAIRAKPLMPAPPIPIK